MGRLKPHPAIWDGTPAFANLQNHHQAPAYCSPWKALNRADPWMWIARLAVDIE